MRRGGAGTIVSFANVVLLRSGRPLLWRSGQILAAGRRGDIATGSRECSGHTYSQRCFVRVCKNECSVQSFQVLVQWNYSTPTAAAGVSISFIVHHSSGRHDTGCRLHRIDHLPTGAQPANQITNCPTSSSCFMKVLFKID